jgi:hypothetical protein
MMTVMMWLMIDDVIGDDDYANDNDDCERHLASNYCYYKLSIHQSNAAWFLMLTSRSSMTALCYVGALSSNVEKTFVVILDEPAASLRGSRKTILSE